MIKKIIFQDSFLVTGIMCYTSCGTSIECCLSDLDRLKQQQIIPQDSQVIINSEPQAFGINRYLITIESEEPNFSLHANLNNRLSANFIEKLTEAGFGLYNNATRTDQNKSKKLNWTNIFVNLISVLTIIILSTVFPPSLFLTIGLTTLSFVTTGFTARYYLNIFYHNLRNQKLGTMQTTITLGWLLALTHTLYHSITMPLVTSFSMTFMSFIMPILLIAIINGMDEVKRMVLSHSQKMHLEGMKTLFPQMSEEYDCYERILLEQDALSQQLKTLTADLELTEHSLLTEEMLHDDKIIRYKKNLLKKDMLIKIKRGECFPVDGIIVHGNTLIDASILTGEPQQTKKLRDFTPAGSINLGQDVIIRASENCYNSTVNKLLLRSNRAQKDEVPLSPNQNFTYFYTSLIILGIAAAIITPWILGILTIPLVLQNVTGILFAICPCTIAIAHQLPKLLSIYRRDNHGILLRDERLTGQSHEIQTIVFDKTGTLTTGSSQVDVSEGISGSVWQRIYLLEKHSGADHPIAKAICSYCETKNIQPSIINDISDIYCDPHHRGLSAIVQGKQLHIGNEAYLQQCSVSILTDFPAIKPKLIQGYTPVHVAEDGVYQGIILIKHEIRETVTAALTRLKEEGKKLIMLTGDNEFAAIGFNQQHGEIFVRENIHTECTHQAKEEFLKGLISGSSIRKTSRLPSEAELNRVDSNQYFLTKTNLFYYSKLKNILTDIKLDSLTLNVLHTRFPIDKSIDRLSDAELNDIKSITGHCADENIKPQNTWFVGDGLNDAPCARIITEKGGVSSSITCTDKAAFFTDISLNGSLDYLFEHEKLNRFLKKIVTQNQWLLAYGAVAFLAFIIGFSLIGVAVSPLIPMIIMVKTTLFTLFNSYRVGLSVDNAFNKNSSWASKLLASDLSIGLLISASALLICGLLISTVATGGLILPGIIFTAGTAAIISSFCILASSAAFFAFTSLNIANLINPECADKNSQKQVNSNNPGRTFTQESTHWAARKHNPAFVFDKIMDSCNDPNENIVPQSP